MSKTSNTNILPTKKFDISDCGRRSVGISPVSTEKIYNWNSDKNSPFKDLNLHRIYMPLSGEACVHTISGDLILKPKHIYFVPANTIIATSCNTLFDHFYIHFTSYESQFDNFLMFNTYLQEVPCDSTTLELFNTIQQNFINDQLYSNLATQGAFMLILSKFFAETTANLAYIKYYNILEYINENLKSKITLNQLAKMANLECAYFSSQFSKTFSISPIQYVNRQRIALAQTLLPNKFLTIKEVSSMCGFENPFYFSKLFKEKTGVSPKKFKESFSKNEK